MLLWIRAFIGRKRGTSFFFLWYVSCIVKGPWVNTFSHPPSQRSAVPYADTSWKHFSQSLLSSKWFEHPSLLQGKGLVKVLFHFSHFSLCLIKNTWQALDMQLALHDHLFVVIFNSLVGYSLQLKKRRCGPSHHTLMYRLLLISLSLCCLLRESLGDRPEIEVDRHLWIPINP